MKDFIDDTVRTQFVSEATHALRQRMQQGKDTYGEKTQINSLREAWEEILDLAFYIWRAMTDDEDIGTDRTPFLYHYNKAYVTNDIGNPAVVKVLADHELDMKSEWMLGKSRPNDAGYDLSVKHLTIIPAGETEKVGLGTRVAIPPGLFGMLTMRSSAGQKGLTLVNGPGIIDSGYTGEISALVHNLSKEAITLTPGERICQLIIIQLASVVIHMTDELPATERGEHGFGSTGTHETEGP